MKIIKIILLGIITSYSAFCQNASHTKSNRTTMIADTATASESGLGQFEGEKLVNLLKGEGYHFLMPFNIGVRVINNGDTSGSFYNGFKWEAGRRFNSYVIPDKAQVEICAVLVDEKNAENFRYHIVQNDERELVPWTKPAVFKSSRAGNIRYCYLGKFNYNPLQLLKVQMYNVNDHYKNNQYTILIDWREIRRASFFGDIQYVSTNSSPSSGRGLMNRGLNDTARTSELHYQPKTGMSIRAPYRDFIETKPSPDRMHFPTDIRIRLGDSLQNISFKNYIYTDIRAVGINEQTYAFKVSLVRLISGHADTIALADAITSFELSKEFWKYPGKYVLTIVPDITSPDGAPVAIPRELIQTISFTVLPPLNVEHKVPLFSVILVIVILLTIIGTAFLIYYQLQKRKLIKEAQNKQIVTLQLQSVRSQLNPHFIFNALASVQNLMNKNAIDDANKYLVRFARLTRNILDDGQKELTTIEHEAAMLNDYLQMEQMRFGFKFSIDIEQGIDQQIEIPAMLLQPFIENAVKHGISALKNEGMVTVSIIKKGDDIVLAIMDNGKGFSLKQPGGMGIKLCEERIKLLNSIYKNTAILLHINFDSKGTLITIALKNWL